MNKKVEKVFTIYQSSAGSGKTYTLVLTYLTLAIRYPAYYKCILAVTFTNKATQEMKDRIIQYLYHLSQGKDTPFGKTLEKRTGLDKASLQQRARLVLSHILHGYSYFSVATIDSFFQKVIRSFAKEIGLQSGFKLELDQERVLDELVEKVLADVGANQQLTKWLVQFSEEKVDKGKSWDIRKDIKELAAEIFKEGFQILQTEITEKTDNKQLIPELLQKLYAVKNDYEKKMHNLGNQALEIIKNSELEISDFKNKEKGVIGHFCNLLKNRFEPTQTRVKAQDNPAEWHTKNAEKADLIEKAFHGGLNDLLKESITCYEQKHPMYLTVSEAIRFIYTFGILSDIIQKLKAYRNENDVLLISDAAVFLKEIIEENEMPFIYEKTGSAFKHFLIDEVQDTSGFQWDNFKPLIANSIAEGNLSMVVGDVKQSIYRWRGGDWELLYQHIKESIGETYTQTIPLYQNWRSRKNIIAFNNSFFQLAPQHLVKALIKEKSEKIKDSEKQQLFLEEVYKIQEIYKNTFQELPAEKEDNNSSQGYINISFIENDLKTSDWKEKVKKKIPALVEKLQDEGYAPGDIAFLVRSKEEGRQVVMSLMEYKNSLKASKNYIYEIVSSEALSLGNASVVRLLISTLKVLKNPADVVAKTEMVYEYQQYILPKPQVAISELFHSTTNVRGQQTSLFSEENDNTHALTNEAFEKLLPERFVKTQGLLYKLPLYELVESLIDIFGLNQVRHELAFLQGFQDLIWTYIKEEKADIISFLEWWSKEGVKHSIQLPEKLNAMRALTIHKAKGLQFKAVILPFCDWSLDHSSNKNNIIWCKTNANLFDKVKYLPLKYSNRLEKTLFQKDYYEEMIRAHVDNLNLLYVAFTRAEESFYAFCNKTPDNQKHKLDTVSRLLHFTLQESIADAKKQQDTKSFEAPVFRLQNEDGISFTTDNKPQKTKAANKATTDSSIRLEHYLSNAWRNKLAIRKNAQDLLNIKKMDKRNYGLIIHKLLSRIKKKKNIQEAVETLYFEGIIGQQDIPALRKKMDDIMSHPTISDWFEADWEVRNEQDILVHDQAIARPDRVMIKDNQAIIVDFKTGMENPSHLRQVKKYKNLLYEMGYHPVEAYLLYLDNITLTRVA